MLLFSSNKSKDTRQRNKETKIRKQNKTKNKEGKNNEIKRERERETEKERLKKGEEKLGRNNGRHGAINNNTFLGGRRGKQVFFT